MQRAAIFNNTQELQPSVSFVNHYGLQPERSLCKIRLYKESAYNIDPVVMFSYIVELSCASDRCTC